jgi:hypothetical protein
MSALKATKHAQKPVANVRFPATPTIRGRPVMKGSLGSNRRFHRGPANGRNRVRRETGKEQMVRVHYDEGVAVRQAKLARSSR